LVLHVHTLPGTDHQRLAPQERMTSDPVTHVQADPHPEAPANLTRAVAMPWALLAAGALAMFAAASSGTTRAPFLLIWRETSPQACPSSRTSSPPPQSPGPIAGMLAGAGSDRWGRRPFLILGPFLSVAFTLVGGCQPRRLSSRVRAVDPSRREAAAACSPGCCSPKPSSRVAEDQQGRALGWGHERPVFDPSVGCAAGRLSWLNDRLGAGSICALARSAAMVRRRLAGHHSRPADFRAGRWERNLPRPGRRCRGR